MATAKPLMMQMLAGEEEDLKRLSYQFAIFDLIQTMLCTYSMGHLWSLRMDWANALASACLSRSDELGRRSGAESVHLPKSWHGKNSRLPS